MLLECYCYWSWIESDGSSCYWKQPSRKLFSKRILAFCEKWFILEILAFDLPSASVFYVWFDITTVFPLKVIERNCRTYFPYFPVELALHKIALLV